MLPPCCHDNMQYMRAKSGSSERSAVTGQVMKKKVKKSSKDKEVYYYVIMAIIQRMMFFDVCFQREKNRQQLLDFLNSSMS